MVTEIMQKKMQFFHSNLQIKDTKWFDINGNTSNKASL